MVSDQDREGQEQAELSPEDIPGASVSAEQIGKLTVSQLKFWLKCRRINQSGNKKELLERYVIILGVLRLSLSIYKLYKQLSCPRYFFDLVKEILFTVFLE